MSYWKMHVDVFDQDANPDVWERARQQLLPDDPEIIEQDAHLVPGEKYGFSLEVEADHVVDAAWRALAVVGRAVRYSGGSQVARYCVSPIEVPD